MSQVILQAVKLGAGSRTGEFSRRVREFLMPWSGDQNGAVTYRVIEPSRPRETQTERRTQSRRRTRLRSGKVLAKNNNGFIIECLIRERSAEGARLQLGKTIDLPDRICLFDDAELRVRAAEVVWRRRNELGIRFTPDLDPTNLKQSDLASLARQFYAVEG
jgi:hypothetical protein